MANSNPEDWRLQGQDRYLQGAVLHWAKWSAPRAEWDHDHCSFCWANFMGEEFPDTLHEGFTTADSYYWICEPCFKDFKDRFQWRLG